MSTQPTRYLTPQQYLEIERAAEFRSEYFNGVMYNMSGGSWRHDRITGDVFRLLGQQLRGRECSVVSSSFRLQVSPDGIYTYPDITVFCGPPKFADRHTDMITDATLIVEVLSTSTENYDRGFKFEQYRRLASLSEYLLISQDRVHIEHYARQADRSWLMRETSARDAVIVLDSIDCTLPVAEAYERVNFEAEG